MKIVKQGLIGIVAVLVLVVSLPASAVGVSDWQKTGEWKISSYYSFYGLWGTAADDVWSVGRYTRMYYYRGGDAWEYTTITQTNTFYGIWGTAADNIITVGSGGAILHYDGTGWNAMVSNSTTNLQDVWGAAADNVFAVGIEGAILHYNGTEWSTMSSGVETQIYSVWGTASNNVYAVGNLGTILHYDGTEWSSVDTGIPNLGMLKGIWGTAADDIFVVGQAIDPGIPVILHFDGTNWTSMNHDVTASVPLEDVWGSAFYDVFAVGYGGMMLHYDGLSWSTVDSATTQNLSGAWGDGNGTVFVCGDGYIYKYNYTVPSGPPPVTVELRVSGLSGDLFDVSGYTVPAGEVTEDTFTLNTQTVLGALVYYCQQNSIDITIQQNGNGLYVYQIGSNAADENTWMYYVDETSPWSSADQYQLSEGAEVHWVNYTLGRYNLTLTLNATEIACGEDITAAVSYTDGDGTSVAVEGAGVYVSSTTDGMGYPEETDVTAGETGADGELTFTRDEAGTYYPYAVWNTKNTLYQYPVVEFTCEEAGGGNAVMSVMPATQTVEEGDTFTVTVDIRTDSATRGGQCNLGYDPALVRVTGVSQGSFYSGWVSESENLYWHQPDIDNEAGLVSNACVALSEGSPDGPSGSGCFIVVQMTALERGTLEITLEEVIVADTEGRAMSATVENGEVVINESTGSDPLKLELVPGWNTVATPISLEDGHNTLGALIEGEEYELAYSYNAATQIWELVDEGYQIEPCQAIFVKMKSAQAISLVVNSELTSPPSVNLSTGWNLVSLAYLEPLKASDALVTLEEVQNGQRGYSLVLSPAVGKQNGWAYIRGWDISDTEADGWLEPGLGYWVYMNNGGTLAGLTSTPLRAR